MPYINEKARIEIDIEIKNIVNFLTENKCLSDEEYISILGKINYMFTRILCQTMGKPSYAKIAMITGVLENIKQEFYRRLASKYEDQKIVSHGDIPEYKKL
jgi:hypothetical protein